MGASTTEEQFVVFNLADETYGVDITSVREIINLQPVTRVPRAPTFVEGLINLRGRVIPVIDLRKRLGLPRAEPTRSTRIVVVEIEGNTIGMVVDGVSEVLTIAHHTIEPPTPLIGGVDAAFLRGVAKLKDSLVIVLTLDRILTVEEKEEIRRQPVLGGQEIA